MLAPLLAPNGIMLLSGGELCDMGDGHESDEDEAAGRSGDSDGVELTPVEEPPTPRLLSMAPAMLLSIFGPPTKDMTSYFLFGNRFNYNS